MKGVTWRRCLLAFGMLFISLPRIGHAQVVINEIMYNPKGTDTGREWIELYNEGASDVTMVGGTLKGSWRIGDGSNHTLTDPSAGIGRGSLVVPAGGYLIVASDPTDFTTGEYAGGTYSAVKSSISLSNSGGTVVVVDGTGAVVDSVQYASTQGASDDGTSLQKEADGSWINALPTPGSTNSITPYVAPPAEGDSSSTAGGDSPSSAQNSSNSNTQQPLQATASYVPPPTPNLYADAGSDREVIVGADVEFDASAYDKTQDLIDPSVVRFLWNFGDGGSGEGESASHHFSYPGRYAVTLTIANSKNAASDQIIVTAEPAALAFDELPDGGVTIQNDAGHDLDLSGWILRPDASSFAAEIILPQHSVILSASSMNISASTLGFHSSSSTMLEYPNGVMALAIGQHPATTSPIVNLPTKSPAASPPVVEATRRVLAPTVKVTANAVEDDPVPTEDNSVVDATSVEPTSSIAVAAVSSATSSKYWWWIGAFGLAGAVAAALIASGSFKKREWDIVEEKPEAE